MALAAIRNVWHTLKGYDNVQEGPNGDVKLDVDSDQRRASNVSLVILGLSLIGMILSMYMIYEFYHPLTKAFCDVSEGVSCTKLVLLGWASLFGVPIAVLGLFWFITLFAAQTLALSWQRKQLTLAILIWTIGGAFFIIYLVSVEVYVGTICPMCTVVHFILLVMLGLATYQFWRYNGCPSLQTIPTLAWQQLPQLLRKESCFLLLAIGFNILPLVVFNTVPSLMGVGDGWTLPMKTQLAQCLHKKHIAVYTKAGCPYCAWQKALFSTAVDLLDITVCTDPQSQPHCAAIGIIGYPTWVKYSHEGKETNRHLGEMPLDELDDWAGCKVHVPEKKNSEKSQA